MAEWVFNRNGRASIIFDEDCMRSRSGKVIAWVMSGSIWNLQGKHHGWYEQGVFYDSSNKALGFIRGHTGYLPSTPGMSGTPGMPGFSGKPGRCGLSGVPGRAGYGGWSEYDLESYF